MIMSTIEKKIMDHKCGQAEQIAAVAIIIMAKKNQSFLE